VIPTCPGPIEHLCSCRCSQGPGSGIFRRCREARRLLKAYYAEEYGTPGYELRVARYADHYDEATNPIVRRQNRKGVWEDV
jgi:hypothetical protein